MGMPPSGEREYCEDTESDKGDELPDFFGQNTPVDGRRKRYMDCDRTSNECGSWDEHRSCPPSTAWLSELFLAEGKRE